jgi:hypothetical protein
MTDNEISALQNLMDAYDAKHGTGESYRIFGALCVSAGIYGILLTFRKAKNRKIILEPATDALDNVFIRYKG